MSKEQHEIIIRASLDFGERPDEEAAWNRLAKCVEEVLEECAADPAFAAIHHDIGPGRDLTSY